MALMYVRAISKRCTDGVIKRAFPALASVNTVRLSVHVRVQRYWSLLTPPLAQMTTSVYVL